MINILLLLLVVRGAMETLQLTKNGSPTININVRKSNKAKRVSIRISGATNEVFLIVPKQVSILNAKQFAISKERWIRKQLRSKFDISKVKLGSLVPVEGFYYLIEIGENKRVKVENNKLLIPSQSTDISKHLKAYLLELSRQRLFSMTKHYCELIGKNCVKVSIKDPKTRWGSCTSKGNLMYSWRLIMAPKSILEYLVVHEVSHLLEMNHSKKFWQHVGNMMPNFRESQIWLKKNGQKLHSYQF
tara:strand:- start:1654 stop:2388 length:735 start_codon:yes stop_codon:yes gene_type:complete